MGVDDAILGTWPVWPAIPIPQQGLADDQRRAAVHACARGLVDADQLAVFCGGAGADDFGGFLGMGEEMKNGAGVVDHAAAAADMLAVWNEWLSGRGGDQEKADRLSLAACFAANAYEVHPFADGAPNALMQAFLQAMVDPLHPDLDYLRAVPESGAIEREKRDAELAAQQIAENAKCPCPAGSITNHCPDHGDPRARKA